MDSFASNWALQLRRYECFYAIDGEQHGFYAEGVRHIIFFKKAGDDHHIGKNGQQLKVA